MERTHLMSHRMKNKRISIENNEQHNTENDRMAGSEDFCQQQGEDIQ